MSGLKQFPIFLFCIFLSFSAAAQSVTSLSMGPNPPNCNTLLTATINGFLPDLCTNISATVGVQGTNININLTFTQSPGICAQIITPFTQNVLVGVLPPGVYTVRCFNSQTGMQMIASQSFTVSCTNNNCQPPTAGHLFANNITATSIRINCTPIAGVVNYQFLYRRVGTSYWYLTPASSQNYWNMIGLVSNANYEYRCRVYCDNGWTAYSPSQFASTLGPQPSGNSCSNAVMLSCGVPYTGSTQTGTNTYTSYTMPNGLQFTNMTGPEKFHKFTLTTTSNVTITLSGLSNNLHLFLLSNCNSNCNVTAGMGYSCNSGTNSEQITFNNLPPGTYVVIVDGYQGAACNYNLTVHCNAAMTCSAPTASQIFFTNQTPTSVRINTSAPGIRYDWAYRAANGAWIELPSTDQNYYDITGLQPGVTYQFLVAVKCSNNVWSNWSAVCYATTPTNNPGANCNNAIPVTCGNSYGGNNGTGGYNYNQYTYNGQTSPETGPEVVYKITVATSTTLTVKLTNLSADLDLFLLGSCTGNNAVLALSGNSGSQSESLTKTLAAGTYYIVADGWNGSTSNYLLTVLCNNNGNNTCSNDEPCGAQVLQASMPCVPVMTTNVNATGTWNPVPAGGCNSAGMKDVWYAVKIPATGKMRVTTGAGTLTNALLGIYSGSNCSYLNCYGCVDNTNGNLMPEVTITGTPGVWVFLRVWGFDGSSGTFTMCVTTLGNTFSQTLDDPFAFTIDAGLEDRAVVADEGSQLLSADAFSLKVFPVPTQSVINVAAQLPADQEAHIRIFDPSGRLVKELHGLQSSGGSLLEEIEVVDLPTGLYIVKVRAGETEMTGRFSKM